MKSQPGAVFHFSPASPFACLPRRPIRVQLGVALALSLLANGQVASLQVASGKCFAAAAAASATSFSLPLFAVDRACS